MEDPLRAIAAAITATSRSVRRMLAVGQALLPAAASATRAARLRGGGARRTMTNITTMFALAVLITSGGLIVTIALACWSTVAPYAQDMPPPQA
jgi:hypothetical protein